jgi:glycosyltransferase involved in cell wall biosynthesis
VTTHGPMNFSEFQTFLSKVDVSIDLFQHNLEREYAMVTRSVISLACGVPVIHPPFTEVSPMIAEYDAGWLVDPPDTGALDKIMTRILDNPAVVGRKKENARALASELLDPAVAVEPLLRIIEGW